MSYETTSVQLTPEALANVPVIVPGEPGTLPTTATIVRKVRASVASGNIVSVTIQMPSDLYTQVEAEAKSDERTVPHYLLRKVREMYATPAANSIK